MKALEVLKQHRKNLISTCARVDVRYDNHELDDAIKELEGLENRSCENCKFKYVVDSMCTECRCNESPIDYIDFDCFSSFSCSEWEPK